ncbi:MAG TPA: UDP-N-acetylglucosamine 2-epimerase [Mucilaginibacter sp.]
MKRIGVLTSSRADYGIYLPLISRLRADKDFELTIIAFGTHLSPSHNHTVDVIKADGFDVQYEIDSLPLIDSPAGIANSMGSTTIKFADFWKEHMTDFDLVFCLGDRYEMFSAVMAGVPFQIPFAHLHGGETTLGAIDNVFRHSITLASKYHFVATPDAALKIEQITGSDEHIYYVGALSLDNLTNLNLLTIDEFKKQWNIDLSKKTILTTFHPETVDYKNNQHYVDELTAAICRLDNYQVLITMPNADTEGNVIRQAFIKSFSNSDRVFLVENLGSKAYFTAMKFCAFLLGNTSSGIIEAASFGKYVINIGNRQKGRVAGNNVIHTAIETEAILSAIGQIENAGDLGNQNVYFNNGAAAQIMEILKQI